MISLDLIVSIAMFAFVTSATPGPNNIMLTASGANFGLWRTLPHVLGILIGMAVLNTLAGVGLGVVFTSFPVLHTLLKWLGTLYLLWLAWKLLRFSAIQGVDGSDQARPFTIIQAAMFQFLNPKAWMMVLSANAMFSISGDWYIWSVITIVAVFGVVGGPSIMIWASFGHYIRRFLTNQRNLQLFNGFMASATAACAWVIWQG